jgi:hypothetical protein
MMRTIAISLSLLFVLGPALRADDKKDIEVKEVDLKALKREFPKTTYDKPTVVTSEDELKKAFPEEDMQTAIKKEVDFSKQQIVFFAWSGSGQDKLAYELSKDNPNEVIFTFTPGRTKDLRGHFHAFVLPKDAKWKMADK